MRLAVNSIDFSAGASGGRDADQINGAAVPAKALHCSVNGAFIIPKTLLLFRYCGIMKYPMGGNG